MRPEDQAKLTLADLLTHKDKEVRRLAMEIVDKLSGNDKPKEAK